MTCSRPHGYYSSSSLIHQLCTLLLARPWQLSFLEAETGVGAGRAALQKDGHRTW